MCKLSDEEVSNRIDARHAAELIAELVDEEAQKYGRVFWEQLHKICCAHVPCLVDEELRKSTMGMQEAREFGRVEIEFGRYEGQCIDEVPMRWLEWYASQDFVDKVRRYLRSRRIQEENNE